MAARPAATAAQKAQRELEDLQLVLRARNGDRQESDSEDGAAHHGSGRVRIRPRGASFLRRTE